MKRAVIGIIAGLRLKEGKKFLLGKGKQEKKVQPALTFDKEKLDNRPE